METETKKEIEVSKPKIISKSGSVISFLLGDSFKQQIALALPKHMTADRMIRIVLTEFRKTPKLMECNDKSLFGAIVQCSQLGLEPGSGLSHAHLIPYGKECQLQIGYKGLIELALRSGKIISVVPRVVYSEDVFEIDYGLNENIIHKPNLKNRGVPIGYYAVAVFKDGKKQFDYMSIGDINKIRDECSKAKEFGSWVKYYDSMAKKTVLKQLMKYLPVSVELTNAINLDEQAEAGVQKNSFSFEEIEEIDSLKVVS